MAFRRILVIVFFIYPNHLPLSHFSLSFSPQEAPMAEISPKWPKKFEQILCKPPFSPSLFFFPYWLRPNGGWSGPIPSQASLWTALISTQHNLMQQQQGQNHVGRGFHRARIMSVQARHCSKGKIVIFSLFSCAKVYTQHPFEWTHRLEPKIRI